MRQEELVIHLLKLRDSDISAELKGKLDNYVYLLKQPDFELTNQIREDINRLEIDIQKENELMKK